MKIKEKFFAKNDEVIGFTQDTLPEEWLLERFRNWRNDELKSTDWTQLSDVAIDGKIWADYRKILRDLPATKDFANAEVPEKPKN